MSEAPTAAPYMPSRRSLRSLRAAAAGCRGCDLYEHATQTVFGEGPARARLLHAALEEAGIDPSTSYVTNAVKHFKFVVRGKRRIHVKPRAIEIRACKPWLEAEVAVVKPALIVALGAMAAQALLGPSFRLLANRGKVIAGVTRVLATVHPSGTKTQMNDLRKKRVAVIVTNGFEESELTEPVKALREAGAETVIVSTQTEPIRAFKHQQPSINVEVDTTLDRTSPDEYDAVLLPGGALNADAMRTEPKAQQFVREMNSRGKPIAVICHAPWLLVSAGLAKGRTLTSWPTIADDLRNAGAHWVDREVVVDGNLVTSRGPKDLPAFTKAMLALLAGAATGCVVCNTRFSKASDFSS